MKLVFTKTKVSIDHITLTSDDNRYLKFDPYIMSRYKYAGPVKTTNSPENKDVSKTYRMFHEFLHLRTGHKLHVFVDRYNTKDYKTLFAPNLTVKFFSSWDNKLAYSEVAWVHNILVENYHVRLAASMVHVAVDLYFRCSADPFLHVLGSIKSGRKITPWKHANYPNTYNFQLANAPFCLTVYDKRKHLLDRKWGNCLLNPWQSWMNYTLPGLSLVSVIPTLLPRWGIWLPWISVGSTPATSSFLRLTGRSWVTEGSRQGSTGV